MTEQINDQISAFIDDELSAEESALLVRRFERDQDAQSRAARYTLIGCALRGELLEPHADSLRQRLAQVLSGAVPAATKPAASVPYERFGRGLARPMLGLGIAAAVAIVAIGSLRMINEARVVPGGAGLPAPIALQARDVDVAPSYVVPQEVPQSRPVTPPIRLTNYLVHHGEYASRLTRTLVNSNVVSTVTEPVVVIDETPTEELR